MRLLLGGLWIIGTRMETSRHLLDFTSGYMDKKLFRMKSVILSYAKNELVMLSRKAGLDRKLLPPFWRYYEIVQSTRVFSYQT